ncbi:Uncharacterised protein [Mycobacterium tuberculosis]|uniref:Uncharacterized protein n=1 Tax=Mycobacterium tuberculosis TaxID=1773 RepID=A0A916PB91_MYCTX|nr:Uncharacterised protein [Mycobacterium tuberculosis]COV95635.1 Uncharacterised protein [Mycobacterium tuberculosis]COW51319.1 Uncharacterised protein [Mycobacterium tuberculosis]COX95847.1 Uncharacterised protein [Mycobacterium tuberculosis]
MQPEVAGQVDLGHAPKSKDFAKFVAVGQVGRGGHCAISYRASDARECGVGGTTQLCSPE